MDRGWGARSTMDRWWCGPKAPERGGALTGAWPPAIPVHGSSPAGAQQREGSTGNSARVSPGSAGGVATGRRRGNGGGERARQQWCSCFGRGGRVRWGRCGDLRGRGGQFIGLEEVRRGGELGNGRWWKLKGGGGIRCCNCDYSRD
jgi:hypothetical protein